MQEDGCGQPKTTQKEKPPYRDVFILLDLDYPKLFNNEGAFHAHLAMSPNRTIVFKGADLIGHKLNGLFFPTFDYTGTDIKFVKSPVMSTIYVLKYNFDRVPFIDCNLIRSEGK